MTVYDTATIVELLAAEDATLVVEYGSSIRNPGTANDIDLFAIYENESEQQGNIRLGPFEIIRLTKSEFRRHRRVLNPVHCTEPVLKGEVRYGSESTFEELRADLKGREPNDEAVRHNLRRSYSEYVKAQEFFNQDDLGMAGRTLSFAVSYRLFAKWYAEGNRPATLDSVRNQVNTGVPVQEVFDILNQIKEETPVGEGQLEMLFHSWEDAVLRR